MPTDSKMQLLIIDDNLNNCTLLECLLEDKYKHQSVCSGQEGLDKAAEGGIDLVLLDVDMPEMDGYEVCKILKANPATASIPIIFVSARTQADSRLLGYEAGGDEYLTKPIDEKVYLLLSKRRLKRRLNIMN